MKYKEFYQALCIVNGKKYSRKAFMMYLHRCEKADKLTKRCIDNFVSQRDPMYVGYKESELYRIVSDRKYCIGLMLEQLKGFGYMIVEEV